MNNTTPPPPPSSFANSQLDQLLTQIYVLIISTLSLLLTLFIIKIKRMIGRWLHQDEIIEKKTQTLKKTVSSALRESNNGQSKLIQEALIFFKKHNKK